MKLKDGSPVQPPTSKVSNNDPQFEIGSDDGHHRSWPGRDMLAWGAILLIVVLQYALFRQHAVREIIWAHPSAYDQAVYLSNTYEAFEKILSHGLLKGSVENLTVPAPNGVMLPIQASTLFLVLGEGRLSALTLSFLYFVVSEL